MDELIKMLTTGLNGKILFWVVILFVFVYIPYLLISVRKRKKKQKIFELKNRDAIKVYLEFDLMGTLTVFNINGEEPTPFYESTRQGFYLFQGQSKVGLQYHWARMSPISVTGYKNFSIEPREIDVYAEKGKTYELGYNIDEDKYKFCEVNG